MLLASIGAIAHDRAVAVLARRLEEVGFVVTHVEPTDDVAATVASASAKGAIVGISVRGPHGLAALPALLAHAPRSDPNARSLFVGGDFADDDGATIAARHHVHVFARDATTRAVVDWLLGEP